MKPDITFMRMRSGDHHGDARMSKKAPRPSNLTLERIGIAKTVFAERKKKGRSTNCASDFLIFAPGLSYDLSKFSGDFTTCFRLRKTITKSQAKIKKSEANFVAMMSMMNKCAKFHGHSPSGKKVKFNLASAIELLETADLVYNFV